MIKLFLILCLLGMSEVKAQEAEAVITEAAVQRVQLPSCQDERLISQVKELLEQYHQEHPVSSLYEKRQRALQLRYITEYEEEKVAGYTAKKNEVVANKLLMTKINQGLADEEIRLCKSINQNAHFKPVYLMMYGDAEGQTQLFVLNFLDNPNEELKTVLK
ncbi:MAG: hypothetical protein IJ529_05465 [Alphaproteobacteria bacterium]|nr:hypothetical protein [Alphaproteobacteria bacterium]MBQ8677897.1 hypothetical protein [Alphaproteobacteria bacterium]